MTFLETLNTLDTNLMIWMRWLVDPNSPTLSAIVHYGGEVITPIVPIFLLVLWLFGTFRREDQWKKISLELFYGIIFSLAIYAFLNFFLIPQFRPSPQDVVWAIAPIIDHPLDNSFPSGHAIFGGAFLMWLILFHFSWFLIWWLSFFLLITLVARVIGWVHYPWDILAGLLFGFLGTFLFQKYIMEQGWFQRFFIRPILRVASWIRL